MIASMREAPAPQGWSCTRSRAPFSIVSAPLLEPIRDVHPALVKCYECVFLASLCDCAAATVQDVDHPRTCREHTIVSGDNQRMHHSTTLKTPLPLGELIWIAFGKSPVNVPGAALP
jgi:hypothetical protein